MKHSPSEETSKQYSRISFEVVLPIILEKKGPHQIS